MPRTKTVKKKKNEDIKTKLTHEIKNDIAVLTEQKKKLIAALHTSKLIMTNWWKVHYEEDLMKIPEYILNSTIADLKNGLTEHSTTVLNCTSSVNSILQETRTSKKTKNKLRRNSFAEDDGYLTAENSGASSGGRQSRSRKAAVPKSTRVSRSLSRSQLQTTAYSHKTPFNRQAPPTYGTVTPKVKPNTPQVILRRPKQGEMALSLQGSPLFTGGVVSETIANINIPLNDGRLFTLQPERGLRMSQVPDLDPETKRQLQTLRDNLNKVCGLP